MFVYAKQGSKKTGTGHYPVSAAILAASAHRSSSNLISATSRWSAPNFAVALQTPNKANQGRGRRTQLRKKKKTCEHDYRMSASLHVCAGRRHRAKITRFDILWSSASILSVACCNFRSCTTFCSTLPPNKQHKRPSSLSHLLTPDPRRAYGWE